MRKARELHLERQTGIKGREKCHIFQMRHVGSREENTVSTEERRSQCAWGGPLGKNKRYLMVDGV